MKSLSTVYGISIVLGSLAAMGAAYAGTKVYPIQTGGDPLAGATALAATVTGVFAAAQKALEPSPEPLATETVKEEAVQEEQPVQETPVQEEAPIEEPPVQETPVQEEAPIEEPPVQEAPVETPSEVGGVKRRRA